MNFISDNTAGVAPEILAALARACRLRVAADLFLDPRFDHLIDRTYDTEPLGDR